MLARRVRTDGFVDPCIPTLAAKPPAGPGWVHAIKHDGYRLIGARKLPAWIWGAAAAKATMPIGA
jgi:hypothetical protein